MGYAYSGADLTATLRGVGGSLSIGAIEGLADEGVKITHLQDSNITKTGVSGTFVHSKVIAIASTVTFEFLKNANVHNKLITMYNLQQLTVGWGENVLSLNSPSSGDSWNFFGVAFTKMPDIDYTKEAGNIVWTFSCGISRGLLGTGLSLASSLGL